MPSRRTVALIFLFWLLTTGYVAYRDVWPRLFAAGPPVVAIDLADEAAQTVPVRWTIFRGKEVVGRLTSQTNYIKEDDTFSFTSKYKELKLEVSIAKCVIPELTTTVRISRGGDLREQSLEGKLEAHVLLLKLEANAQIRGKVIDGQLTAECDIQSSFGNFKQQLDPVRVPKGQPLNPLQPVNRLTNLKPGSSWPVEKNSPLDDAVGTLIRKKLEKSGVMLREEKPKPLFAKVLSEQQNLDWHGQLPLCWVIEYRQDEPVARTWVRASDGKVLKQEAFRGGEHLTIERDE